jgi:hypothetical protein
LLTNQSLLRLLFVCKVQLAESGLRMAAPYDIRPDPSGWTVFDITTDLPATVDGFLQCGLTLEDADDLADLLNRLHTEQLAASSH